MNQSIFRAYDIRGVYPTELDEKSAEKIGQAFATFIFGTDSAKKRVMKFGEEPIIAVGGDVRLHTQRLKGNLVSGITSTGAKVIDFGILPTPLLYFAVAHKRLDGGVVVTASHNPKEYNGLKLCAASGVCLSWDTGIKSVLDFCSGTSKVGAKHGEYTIANIVEDYKHFISTKINLHWLEKLKVVIDGGNGVCGNLAAEIFESGGCDVVKLYCEPDGNFPNHEPDPIKKSNLKDLQKSVLENKADLGIGYDGDGDRVAFIGPDGKPIESYVVLSIFSKEMIKNKPGAKIVFDVTSSKTVEDTISGSGGVPVQSRVGHSFIQSKILFDGCDLAGEHSGHYFFKENFGFDDAIFASLKFATLVAKHGLDNLTKDIPLYITADEVRVFCNDREKFDIVEKLKVDLKNKYETVEIDGVKAKVESGWFLIRASNTVPALGIRWEAKTQEDFDKIKGIIQCCIAKYGLDTNW
ncbi:MAG: phosphomannomutase/phosphoglucomutase [Candidatus Aenigmarchaeota archaeon]|nr:phosphomannomutase/phosphoglucomutase [Candidatus Aenigmarchaeota archaeon]